MCVGSHVKYPLSLSDFNKSWSFFWQIIEKCSNIKLHENPSSGSGVVPVQMDRHIDGRTYRQPWRSSFLNFTNAPRNTSTCKIQTVGSVTSVWWCPLDWEMSVRELGLLWRSKLWYHHHYHHHHHHHHHQALKWINGIFRHRSVVILPLLLLLLLIIIIIIIIVTSEVICLLIIMRGIRRVLKGPFTYLD